MGTARLFRNTVRGPIRSTPAIATATSRAPACPTDERFNIGVQDGNHLACFLYHAQESPLAPPDHCLGDLLKKPADSGIPGGSVTCH